MTGCASMGGAKTQQEQMQTRMTELEKKVEEKDSEIVDLQYQVKDLSSKVNTKDSADASSEGATAESMKTPSKTFGDDDVIRVNASVEDVQMALKNAGVYSGKVDGKAGPGTKAAIMAFQREHHLTADGVLGKRTWRTLKSYLKE